MHSGLFVDDKIAASVSVVARCVGRDAAYSARHSPLSVQLNTHLYDAFVVTDEKRVGTRAILFFVDTTHALLTLCLITESHEFETKIHEY